MLLGVGHRLQAIVGAPHRFQRRVAGAAAAAARVRQVAHADTGLLQLLDFLVELLAERARRVGEDVERRLALALRREHDQVLVAEFGDARQRGGAPRALGQVDAALEVDQVAHQRVAALAEQIDVARPDLDLVDVVDVGFGDVVEPDVGTEAAAQQAGRRLVRGDRDVAQRRQFRGAEAPGPALVDFFRPLRLEERDDRVDRGGVELVLERGHLPAERLAALADRAPQDFEIVMPRVRGAIERRRRVIAVGVGLLPVRRRLGIAAVAGRAVFDEQLFAALDLLGGKPALVTGGPCRRRKQQQQG